MSRDSKHQNAVDKKARLYDKLDEHCKFEEPKKETKKSFFKKTPQGIQQAEICKTCIFRIHKCWIGYRKSGICREYSCKVYQEDVKEKERLEQLSKSLPQNPSQL